MLPILFSKLVKKYPIAGDIGAKLAADVWLAERMKDEVAKNATQPKYITKNGIALVITPKSNYYMSYKLENAL